MDIEQFHIQQKPLPNQSDSLEKKIANYKRRGWSPEKIARMTYKTQQLNHDSLQRHRDLGPFADAQEKTHYQSYCRRVEAIFDALGGEE